jgi:hypothetical protein
VCYDPEVKKERGNIILAALFVAVFLFFLSIALIWTNRQDIALSLAMEHKMKAEAAARSGAMSVYAALRAFDKPPEQLFGELASGASWKVELLELPPEGRRGKVVLVHCRGTSGPLSSYFTLHLQKTELGSGTSVDDGRMLGFPAAGETAAENGGEAGDGDAEAASDTTTPSAEASGSTTVSVLYGDFEVKTVDLKLALTANRYAAMEGPLFVSGRIPQTGSPLQAYAYLPVLDPSGAATQAYGPLIMNAPRPKEENALSVLSYSGGEFRWDPVPFPKVEVDEHPNPAPLAAVDLTAPDNASWTTLGVRAVASTGSVHSWRDSKPATSSVDEASDLALSSSFDIDTNSLVDWSSVSTPPPNRGYSLRGCIAAYKKTVYSHAWEYLYRSYDGAPVAMNPIPEVVGSTLTRWPCIRKYDSEEKQWSTVWSALKDNGDVKSEVLPDPEVLLVTSQGVCYSRTLETPYRLLKLDSGGNASIGKEIPNGQIFLYQDRPFAVSSEPPGLVDLEGGKDIGFGTLVSRIPEIFGPVVTQMPNEEMGNGLSKLEVSSLDGDDPTTPEMRTVRQQYDLTYSITPGSSVVCDGKDLYTNISIAMTKEQPSYELFGGFALKDPPRSILARYDGERWHILPNGLLAALTQGIASPGGQMFCAHYDELPSDKSRYSVISIDTDPFEFSR